MARRDSPGLARPTQSTNWKTTDLVNWQEWLRLIPSNGAFRVQDSSSSGVLPRFYRFSTTTLTPADDWKNQTGFSRRPVPRGGEELTKSAGSSSSSSRTIRPASYFQDSTKYVLHYEFAKARISPVLAK